VLDLLLELGVYGIGEAIADFERLKTWEQREIDCGTAD